MKLNIEAVHAHLKQAFRLDPDAVHVTEVGDVINQDVIISRTLVEESLHWLKRGEEPTYDPGLFGLFHQPGTFDSAHRVGSWRLQDLEKQIGKLLQLV